MRCAMLVLSLVVLLGGFPRSSANYTPDRISENGGDLIESSEWQSARLFDQFGAVASNDEKARLDVFAIALQNEPGAQGYIIVYGRRSRPGEAKKRADRQKQYLLYYRGIGKERIVSLDHCFKTRLEVELWIVPRGAKAPVPCPAKGTKR